jgi:hypothetical protein
MDRDPHIRPDGIWDDNYYQTTGRFLQAGGGVAMPEFNFDFAGEAEKAYGELGTYYDRILKESEGDMNKVLARMATDYETGVRRRSEDLTTGQEQIQRAVQDNALARGIYQKSAYGPGGYGVADTMKTEAEKPLFSAFNRAEQDATTSIERNKLDIPEQQKRYAFDMEQQRRRESSDLANTRGQRAYSDWSRKNAFNPSMV